MSKRNTTTITFSLSMELANRFEKLAGDENKSKDQLFQDMLTLYEEDKSESEWQKLRRYASKKVKETGIQEKDLDRIIHKVRADIEAGKISGGMIDEEINQLIRDVRGN